jgi:endonuclease/exonuclease/phosphatase family metal-dependent hydrolase
MTNPAQNPSPRSTLRALTLNLWGETAPLPRRLSLCTEQIARLAPDVIALQEVRQVAGRVQNTAETLARSLNMDYVFVKTVEWGGGDEGLALLSAMPRRDFGSALLPHPMPEDQRIVLWALFDSGAGTVAAFTTHLTYRMTHGTLREDQVATVDNTVKEVIAKAQPQPLMPVLMGDFNAAPDADEIRFLRGLHTLQGRRTYYQDAFLTQINRSHAPQQEHGSTWSRKNPGTHKLRFLEADRRIDYIFVGQTNRDGRGQVLQCRVVLDEPDADGVFPSDHFGVFSEVQLLPSLP